VVMQEPPAASNALFVTKVNSDATYIASSKFFSAMALLPRALSASAMMIC
jgi:hypothetical protein